MTQRSFDYVNDNDKNYIDENDSYSNGNEKIIDKMIVMNSIIILITMCIICMRTY